MPRELILQPKQLELGKLMYRTGPDAATWVGGGGARAGGKALALDTPIATPNGWTRMVDLRVGDQVFDEHGNPCNVTALSEIMRNPCIKLVFDDGTIIADYGHQWLMSTGSIKTTKEITSWDAIPLLPLSPEANSLLKKARSTSDQRYIREAEDVGLQLVCCISVDSPSRLYLAGECMVPTHNSGGLRRIMLDRRQQRPGTNGAIVRRVYDEVKKNHIDKYMEEFPELRDCYRVGDKEFVLPNGSKIMFMYAENQQEIDRKFWGIELYDIFVDQAEQFSEYELTIIHSCNRWPNTALGECKTGLFFNPGGVGTEFLRRVFSQKRFIGEERPSDYAFVHLFGWDNYVWFNGLGMTPKQFYAKSAEERFEIFVNQTTEGRKLNAMPQSLRAGHLLGSFDSFAGQYFAGVWDESKLILTAEQEAKLIQPWWPRWSGHDDGFVHHAAIGSAAGGKVAPKLFHDVFGVAIDEPVEVWVVYRDYVVQETEQGELIRQYVAQMDADEKKQMKRYFLSVDAWEKDSKGHSTADTINQELRLSGLPWAEQAANGRIGGWRFLYAMMKKTADVLAGKMEPTRQNDDYDKEGGYSAKTPLMFICSRCTDVIEAIPMAIRDTKHPGRAEDVWKQPTKSDDVLDMIRYLCYSMHSAKMEEPLSVRAQEFYESLGDRSMHDKGMAVLKWKAQNERKRGSSWSGRQ